MITIEQLNNIEDDISQESMIAEPELIQTCEAGIELMLECGEIIINREKPITGEISVENSKNFFVSRFLATTPELIHWSLKTALAGNYSIASILLRPILESQISMIYYLEFPEASHQLMRASFVENAENGEEKSTTEKKFFDPKPSTKMKRLNMDQNHIVYKNWEDFNKLMAHPFAPVPSLYASKENRLAVEPFYNPNSLRIVLNYLIKTMRVTLSILLSRYTYLADPDGNWYIRLQEKLRIKLETNDNSDS